LRNDELSLFICELLISILHLMVSSERLGMLTLHSTFFIETSNLGCKS